MYTIYHIPEGSKIGCTDNLRRRMKRHGNPDYEILEEHTCIHEASERERELQKQYGYKVDHRLYSETAGIGSRGGRAAAENSGKASHASKLESGYYETETFYNAVNAAGKARRGLTYEQAQEIRKLYATGNYSKLGLAKQFKTNSGSIDLIVRNRTYKQP